MPDTAKHSPAELAQPILPHTAFQSLDLIAVSAARYPELDNRGAFDAPITPSDGVEIGFDTETRRAVAAVTVKIVSEDEKGKLLEVTALFRVVYEVKETYQGDRLEERTRAFCQSHALAHVWPYWRELLASLTVRMGLPTILAPLLLVGSSGSVRSESTEKPAKPS